MVTLALLAATLSTGPAPELVATPASLQAVLEGGWTQLHDLDYDRARRAFRTYQRAVPDDPRGYLYGAVDYLRVLDVLLTDQNLERTRLTAERELIDNRIALCRALAGGWTLERPAVAGAGTRITHVDPR